MKILVYVSELRRYDFGHPCQNSGNFESDGSSVRVWDVTLALFVIEKHFSFYVRIRVGTF